MYFADDFNRSDSPTSLGSADWTHLSEYGWAYPSLLDNEAQGTSQSYEVVCLHTTPADTAEQYAEADIWNGSGECGLTICADINATSWATGYHLHVPYWYSSAILRRNGVEVVHLPRSHSTESAFARYRIELVGDEVRAYENDVLLGTWTDPAPLTGSYVGINLGENNGNGRVDNFEGGDLVPAEPLYFADDFNRADSADFGPDWTELADGDGEIVNNEAIIPDGSGESCLAWATPAATAKQFSQHLVTADWANNTARGPFIFSDLSSDTAGYMISWRASDNRWRIWRNQTAVHTVNSGPDIVAGDIIRIESEPDGSSLIVRTYHNGNLVNEYTDSTPLAGQYVGFNLRTDQIAADDWSGGDVDAEPGPGGDDVTGSAESTISALSTATGVRGTAGSASSSVAVSSAAAGVRGTAGVAASAVSSSATAAGVRGVAGSASSTVTATSVAAGETGATGSAESTVSTTATATGVRGVLGHAESEVAATSTASGVGSGAGEGSAESTVTATSTASGVRGVSGAATSTVSTTATATGQRAVTGTAASSITATSTASGVGGGGGGPVDFEDVGLDASPSPVLGLDGAGGVPLGVLGVGARTVGLQASSPVLALVGAPAFQLGLAVTSPGPLELEGSQVDLELNEPGLDLGLD